MTFEFIVGTLIPNYLSATIAFSGLVVAIISLRAARASGRAAASAQAEADVARARSEELDRRELALREDTTGAISSIARWFESRENEEAVPDNPYIVRFPITTIPRRGPAVSFPWPIKNEKNDVDFSPDKQVVFDYGKATSSLAETADVPISVVLDGYASRIANPPSSGTRVGID